MREIIWTLAIVAAAIGGFAIGALAAIRAGWPRNI
jgi:hypothetical protein